MLMELNEEEMDEYFMYCAARAMQGILSNPVVMDNAMSGVINGTIHKNLDDHVAGMAVEYADSLLKAIKQRSNLNP